MSSLLGLLKSNLIVFSLTFLLIGCENNTMKKMPLYLKKIPDEYSLIVMDMVGVIYDEKSAMPGAVNSLNNLKKDEKKVILLTNNPRPNHVAKNKLKKLGFPDDLDIFTSGDATLFYIDKHFPNKKIYHLGQHKNTDLLHNKKEFFTSDIQDADIIILSLFCEENEDDAPFIETLKLISKTDKPVLCSNPDIHAPFGNTTRRTAGYYAKILEDSGKKVIYMGKPHTFIYDLIWQKFNLTLKDKERALMIGDTLETDILGANNFGISSLLVLSGNTAREIIRKNQSIHGFMKEKEPKLTPHFYMDHV